MPNIDYIPEGLAQEYKLLRELLDYLSEEELVGKMIVPSRRGVPDVPALDFDCEHSWRVLHRASQMGIEFRVKQMFSRMTRRLLESDKVRFKWIEGSLLNSWTLPSGTKYKNPRKRPHYIR